MLIKTVIDVCDLCGSDEDVRKRRLSFLNHRYRPELCGEHQEQLERVIDWWALHARVVTFPQFFDRLPERPEVRPALRLVSPKAPAQPRERNPEAEALNNLIGSKARGIEPGVNIIHSKEWKPDGDDGPVYVQPRVHSSSPGIIDDPSQLELAASKVREVMRDGLPPDIGYEYHPDVEALQGFDFDILDAAIRAPERVQIRPETATKKYPVLAFWRGDVACIMGMRNPARPMLIAAYVDARLEGDAIVSRHPAGGGGGGKRKDHGLPNTVAVAIRRLREAGCEIDTDDPAAVHVDVHYKGQDLGKITIGSAVQRQAVQSDYQRIVRKMHAIDQRMVAVPV